MINGHNRVKLHWKVNYDNVKSAKAKMTMKLIILTETFLRVKGGYWDSSGYTKCNAAGIWNWSSFTQWKDFYILCLVRIKHCNNQPSSYTSSKWEHFPPSHPRKVLEEQLNKTVVINFTIMQSHVLCNWIFWPHLYHIIKLYCNNLPMIISQGCHKNHRSIYKGTMLWNCIHF